MPFAAEGTYPLPPQRRFWRSAYRLLWAAVFLAIGIAIGYAHSPALIVVRTFPRWPVASNILYAVVSVALALAGWRLQSAIERGMNSRWRAVRMPLIGWSAVAVGLGVLLAILATNEALAEKPVGSPCVAQTQNCVHGYLHGDSTSCTAPEGVVITRYKLSVTFSKAVRSR
jgi:H+/Cl- antiporter ClcA